MLPYTEGPGSARSRLSQQTLQHSYGIGMSLCDALLRDLSALIGEECWGAVCGEGTGAVLWLDIGVRTLKRRPTNNPHLTELVRLYDGTYSFLIWCSWRIDSISKVVAGSHMSNVNGGPMVEGSQSICGQRIMAVTCSAPAFRSSPRLRKQALTRHPLQCYWLELRRLLFVWNTGRLLSH